MARRIPDDLRSVIESIQNDLSRLNRQIAEAVTASNSVGNISNLAHETARKVQALTGRVNTLQDIPQRVMRLEQADNTQSNVTELMSVQAFRCENCDTVIEFTISHSYADIATLFTGHRRKCRSLR